MMMAGPAPLQCTRSSGCDRETSAVSGGAGARRYEPADAAGPCGGLAVAGVATTAKSAPSLPDVALAPSAAPSVLPVPPPPKGRASVPAPPLPPVPAPPRPLERKTTPLPSAPPPPPVRTLERKPSVPPPPPSVPAVPPRPALLPPPATRGGMAPLPLAPLQLPLPQAPSVPECHFSRAPPVPGARTLPSAPAAESLVSSSPLLPDEQERLVAAVAAAVAGSDVAPTEKAALLQAASAASAASSAAASIVASETAVPSMEEVCIEVVVEAQDEEGVVLEYRCLLPHTLAIRPLLDAWAEHNHVPASCVTFEDAEARPLDLSQAPSELGWLSMPLPIRVFARPAEDDASGMSGSCTEAPVHHGGFGSAASAGIAAAPWNSPVAPWNNRSTGGADPADEEVDLFGDAEDTEDEDADEAEGRVGLCTLDRANKDSHDGAETLSPPEKRRRVDEIEPKAEESPAKPKAAVVEAGGPRKPDGASSTNVERSPPEEVPTPSRTSSTTCGGLGEDEIVFQEANPKPKGSQAHDRYDKYKAARTVREALVRGATKDDIAYDLKRGFLKRRSGS